MFREILKVFVSQKLINNYYHLPKAVLANIIFGFPTKKLKVIGVTGTDGKSTTTNMIYQILKDAGEKVSMVSSVNAVIGGKEYDTGFHVSSPDPMVVQKFARQALEKSDKYLVLEVTSHGLDQYRFWGIKFEAVVFTNITHDHLDYHKTFENYFNTKLKLSKKSKFIVVNKNIASIKGVLGKVLTFGLNKGDFNQKDIKLKLKIIGDYNIENALAALAVAYVLNIPKKIAQKSLEQFKGIKGRMEEVKNNLGIKIVIDFASTPNALEQALKTLRQETKSGRLIAVFGSASQRDLMKRPMMGEISAKLANITIVTDEDPRYEDRNKIIEEIAQGAKKEGAKEGINLFKEPDRQKAIKLAISLAKKGDTVGIFGKGHEQSINYNGVETPWSERGAVNLALSTLSGRKKAFD